MPGRRHLLDALPEGAAPANDVSDLGLVSVHLDRARAHKVRSRVEVDELCCHEVPFKFVEL
jgi:hypothetical protein